MDRNLIFERLDALINNDKRAELRGAMRILNPADAAEYMKRLDAEKLTRVFRILPKDTATDVFSYMDEEQRRKLSDAITDIEIASIIDGMFVDDAVDYLEELPADFVKRVLANVQAEQRKLINKFLSYPDDSAGSVMTSEFLNLPLNATAQDAIDDIKRAAFDKETVYTLYVLDENGGLYGELALSTLIMAKDDALVSDICRRSFITVNTLDDREYVAEVMRKYDLLTLPVLDRGGRMVGIITADDIMDVIEQEATEDIEKMGALTPAENGYMVSSVLRLSLNRLPWLIIMMLGSILTGLIITHYNAVLMSVPSIGVALTACIPMLMDTGGNCGSQSSVLAIRGLAVGEITLRDTPRILWKELRVAFIVSIALALTNMAIQTLVFGNGLDVSITVSVAMIATVILAKAIGCLLPLAAKAVKLDPALAATPLITTLVDSCALVMLFRASQILLK